MRALWETGGGNVQAVRDALPPDDKHAYTTIQTVLNRLVERGLVTREREGIAFRYAPSMAEPDYVSGAIDRALSDASPGAREAALAQLVGALGRDELKTLERLAAQVEKRRGDGAPS